MLYNKDGTTLFKLAHKIKKDSRILFTDLEKLRLHHELPLGLASPASVFFEETKQEGTETPESEHPRDSIIGDLEPTSESLELFVFSDAILQGLNMELDDSMPVASLFKYELAKMKPPPPELSEDDGETGPFNRGRKGGRRAKPKRDRKAEAERARLNKLAREDATPAEQAEMEGQTEHGGLGIDEEQKERELQAMLDASAGFRAPLVSTLSAGDERRRATESELSIPEGASRIKKRPSALPVNQPTVPRVVSTVDDRDSFSLFNAGWILPADQKRGGRAPISQQLQPTTQPPPRKKQKTGMRVFAATFPMS